MPAVSIDDALVLPRLPLPGRSSSRRPQKIVTAHQVTEGAGVTVWRPLPGPIRMAEGDPIIFLDHIGPKVTEPGEARGAPWHPHRGIETVSYVIDGELSHHDSNGGGGVIREGDTQWMTAGGGILHDELPTERFFRSGGLFHGFQLWVNLPSAMKFCQPRYQAIPAQALCLLTTPDVGALIRLVAGDLSGFKGPGLTHTPITCLHATIAAGAEVSVPWNPVYNALAYVLTGQGYAGAERAPIVQRQMVLFGQGDHLTIGAAQAQDRGAEALDVLVVGGLPIRDSLVAYGGFVMNTERQIGQAMDDFRHGRLGSIPADQLQPRRFS